MNTKTACLLEELKDLKADFRQSGQEIARWRSAMLPFSVALWALTLKFDSAYPALVGLILAASAINQCSHRLRDMISASCYIIVFIEEELEYMYREHVLNYDILVEDKTPASYTSILYFTVLGLISLALAALYVESLHYGIYQYLAWCAVGLPVLLRETRLYMRMPRLKPEIIENYRRRKAAFQKNGSKSANMTD